MKSLQSLRESRSLSQLATGMFRLPQLGLGNILAFLGVKLSPETPWTLDGTSNPVGHGLPLPAHHLDHLSDHCVRGGKGDDSPSHR